MARDRGCRERFEHGAATWFPCVTVPVSWLLDHKETSLSLETREFRLRDDHVRLCDLLKLAGVADSGGRGKQLVTAGAVTVDGQAESRKTAKIRAGQQVDCEGVRIRVRAPE